MHKRLALMFLLAGCTASMDAPVDDPDSAPPLLMGFASPCHLEGWSHEAGICARAFPAPDPLGHAAGFPVIATDPNDPDRIAVVLSLHARDVGYVTGESPIGPEHHWTPWVATTSDGGASWQHSLVPFGKLYYSQSGGDPHAQSPYALFDSQGTLHVLALIAGGNGPPGMVHATSQDGLAWHGGPVFGSDWMRVPYAWEEAGHLYAVIDNGWREDPATVWTTPADDIDWKPLQGYACRLAVDDFERLPRTDLGAWPNLPCPGDGRTYQAINASMERVGKTGFVACSAAFVVPLGNGTLSLGNAYVTECQPGIVQVGDQTTTMQSFFGRPADEAPPFVMAATGDGLGNAVVLAGALPSLPEAGIQPLLASVSANETTQVIALAESDAAALGIFQTGRCGLAMEGAVWVACAAGSGELRMFRLEPTYA